MKEMKGGKDVKGRTQEGSKGIRKEGTGWVREGGSITYKFGVA
jgi:hypothetical protein